MTQYPGHGQRLPSGPIHAICRGCWLPLSNLWFVWRLELWLCGDTLVPVRLEHGWVFCCLFELTSPSRLEVSQDLPAPIKSVAQQLPTAGQVTAVLQGSEGDCPHAPGALLCTSALPASCRLWPPPNCSKQGALATLCSVATELHEPHHLG